MSTTLRAGVVLVMRRPYAAGQTTRERIAARSRSHRTQPRGECLPNMSQRISGRHGHGQHLRCHHANSGSAMGSWHVRRSSTASRRSICTRSSVAVLGGSMNRASCSLSRAQPSPQHGQANSASHCLHRRLVPWTRTDHTLSATDTMPGDNRPRSSRRTAAFAAPDRPGTSRYRTQGLPQPRSRGRSEAGVLRGTAPSDASHGRHPPTAQDRPDRTRSRPDRIRAKTHSRKNRSTCADARSGAVLSGAVGLCPGSGQVGVVDPARRLALLLMGAGPLRQPRAQRRPDGPPGPLDGGGVEAVEGRRGLQQHRAGGE